MEIRPRAKLPRRTPQSELHEVAVDLAEDAELPLEEEEVVDHRGHTLQNLHDQRVAHLQVLHDREYHQDLVHHDPALHEEEDLDPGLSLVAHEGIVDTEAVVLGEDDS
jgi:hypothetical protein